ncbi:MAG TPA: type I glyceraldehyde-3-phosphate dehydrogenase [Acidimicrobiales bacterium]|nr:type I glyceraldehyde-3-phosphate dehydrogenase [Acidimicrobiales bacterium]
MSTRIAINGFGRMGRAACRIVHERDLDIDLVAINELGSPATMANLLARDSVHGRFAAEVTTVEGGLEIDGDLVRFFSLSDPRTLPWAELDVDVVIESTGHFRTRDTAAAHLDAGARRVVVSAPCKEADATFVIGVNDQDFDPARHHVVSNASCTTNCLVPMVSVLQDRFGIEQGFITTVHAYTGDQALVDGPHKDARRARAAALNIVPTSTGAARATSAVISAVDGRLDGTALRVPVADGSITDFVALVERSTSIDEVNAAFAEAAAGPLAGVLEYSVEPLVSSDIVGSAASCVFDAPLTMVGGHLVKVFGWYDNEWGYANRLVELAALVGGQ